MGIVYIFYERLGEIGLELEGIFSLFLIFSEFINSVEEDDVVGSEEVKKRLEEFSSHAYNVFVFGALNFSCVASLRKLQKS